jgi:hypothetical protein
VATPRILRHRVAWKRASMVAALGYRLDATGAVASARLCVHLQPDSYDTDSLIGVLEQLAGFYRGQRVVLLGMACRRTGATRCAPTCMSNDTGARSNGCRPTRPSSTRSSTCGRI